MKVSQFYNKNQFIITHESKIFLQSYNSIIVEYHTHTKTIFFGCDWDYSKTTLKHLYLFLKDYINNIYQLIAQEKNKKNTLQKLIDKEIIKLKSF